MNTNKTANVKSGFKLTFLFILLILSTGFSQDRASLYDPATAVLLPGEIDSNTVFEEGYSFGKPNESASIYEKAALSNHSSNQHFFIENKGQWPQQVRYLTQIGGLDAWITNDGVVYDHFVYEQDKSTIYNRDRESIDQNQKEYPQVSSTRRGHVVHMKMLDIDVLAVAEGFDKQEAYNNYFKGNDPSKWASFVPLYKEIAIREVYSGIDIKYYFENGLLRYDFHVHPGSDVKNIRFELEGVADWRINPHGELVIETDIGEVVHGQLYAYQTNKDIKTEIPCQFTKHNDGSLGLIANDFDKDKLLIIDPLVFSTFLGGNSHEGIESVKIDYDGNIIVAGSTHSSDFPSTPGAYQTIGSNNKYDVFVTKLTPELSGLVFSTYISGNQYDFLADMQLGSDGSIFLAGSTGSPNFPITENAFQTENIYEAAFVSRLHPDGASLVYSTYLGGSDLDYSTALWVNSNNEAIVAGVTMSYDFPWTPGALQAEYSYTFVTKFNDTGTDLIFSALLSEISIQDIFIGADGIINLTGYGFNNGIVPTPDAYQQTCPNWQRCAFVVVLDANATEFLYATFLGGSEDDFGMSIYVAENGDVIVGGNTNSNDFPVTSGVFQTTYAGDQDLFVARLSPSLSSLLYSTFIGGDSYEYFRKLILDSDENVYIIGTSLSENYPTTLGAFQTSLFSSSNDVVISKMLNDGTEVLYSTYLGGNSDDTGKTIDIMPDNQLIVAGVTGSEDFPVTTNAYQQINAGFMDVFISKLIPVGCFVECNMQILENLHCHGGNNAVAIAEPFGGNSPYTYAWSNGQTGATATNLSAGTYTVLVTDAIGCTTDAQITITDPPLLVINGIETFPASCQLSMDGSASVSASGGTPPLSFIWSNGETGQTAYNLPAGENTVTVTDANDCQENLIFEIDYILPFDEEEICAVSVNPENGNNTVLWQKTENVRTIAFNIYREGSASGVYELIGSKPFSDDPVFEDHEANPAQQSYRYKLSVVDSCQEESGLSSFHKTIHLSMNTGVNNEINLLWTLYEGFTYPTHYIMRSVNNGPFHQIGLVPSSNLTFTDVSPPSGTKKYLIEIDSPQECTPLKNNTRVMSNTVVHIPTSIETVSENLFSIYPNPTGSHVIVETQLKGRTAHLVLSTLDGVQLSRQRIVADKTEVNLDHLAASTYWLQLEVEGIFIEGRKIVKK